MNLIKYLFSYKKNKELIKKLRIRVVDAEGMMNNYRLSLDEANSRLEKAGNIIMTRDKEIQEWDDINTELTKRIKEYEAKPALNEKQIAAAETLKQAFEEIKNYSHSKALKRKWLNVRWTKENRNIQTIRSRKEL